MAGRSDEAGEAFETSEADAPTRAETARYVADMTVELARMARAAGLPLVAYFLDMTHQEAREAESPQRVPRRRTR